MCLYGNELYHAQDKIKFMLCYFYVMLCYFYVIFMLCYFYVMLCYVMLCYVMLCYVMLCYVMLCYVMLCYVMLSWFYGRPHCGPVCGFLVLRFQIATEPFALSSQCF